MQPQVAQQERSDGELETQTHFTWVSTTMNIENEELRDW